MHNILDATAAIAIGLTLRCDLEVVRAAIADFSGVDRRFQLKGEIDGIRVFDDYGHHPTELAATLAAAREVVHSQSDTPGRILMIFQPHRYTRTQHLQHEFAQVLSLADQTWLLDIYPAGETPIPDISSTALATLAQSAGAHVTYMASADAALAAAASAARPGDLILTQGAGSVSSLGAKLLEALQLARASAVKVPRS